MDADHIFEFDRYELKGLLIRRDLEISQLEYIVGFKVFCKVI